MEFRTKREAVEAATNLDARRPALERARRDAQARGDIVSAMEWGATMDADGTEAARIRAMLPRLEE